MIAIRRSRPEDGARAIAIWREAVDATHPLLHLRHFGARGLLAGRAAQA
jgi:hypothetical protein